MDMAKAMEFVEMVNDNAKEWDAARIEAFDKLAKEDAKLVECAYEILTKKVEDKEERRRKARKRVEEAKEKREAEGNDAGQHQQHQQGGFHES